MNRGKIMMENLTIKNKGAIVPAQVNGAEVKKVTGAAKTIDTQVSESKTRVISFRVTTEQYKEIMNKCSDAQGVQLITLAEMARLSLLTQRVIKVTEDPLDRYRIAIAGEMASGITEIVQMLDQFIDMNEYQFLLSDFVKIIQYLETIQRTAEELMTVAPSYKKEASNGDY